MSEHNGDELAPVVRDAVRQLREAPLPEPGDLWRQRLLHRAAAGDVPRDAGTPIVRRWTFRPVTAIAAGLACMVLGGATVAIVTRPGLVREAQQATPAEVTAQVRFTIVAPDARQVAIVGDFNGWNAAALPMRRAPDGATWELMVPLRPGRYAYSFVVDGVLARDPRAPQAADDDFGSPNSIVLVKGS